MAPGCSPHPPARLLATIPVVTLFLINQRAFVSGLSDGSDMPVAALRRPAKDLPFDFTLTDATAVMPGARLSDFEDASVSARVSAP